MGPPPRATTGMMRTKKRIRAVKADARASSQRVTNSPNIDAAGSYSTTAAGLDSGIGKKRKESFLLSERARDSAYPRRKQQGHRHQSQNRGQAKSLSRAQCRATIADLCGLFGHKRYLRNCKQMEHQQAWSKRNFSLKNPAVR